MIIEFSKLDVFYGLAINGIFTGLGVAIGTYIANTHVIGRIKIIKRKIRRSFYYGRKPRV